jgi:hypothetical protein
MDIHASKHRGRDRRVAVLILLGTVLTLVGAPHNAAAATIRVTSLQQKITSIGGCSLQEAIYASRLQQTFDGVHGTAINFVNIDGTSNVIPTQCLMGTGNDIIVLPTGGVFDMHAFFDDPSNYLGPTATPFITSTITIQGNGAQLIWTGNQPAYGNRKARAFAVGTTCRLFFCSTGSLTIENLYVRGFIVKGGDSVYGGGGLGAGGAIYVNNGTLVVENSTFEANAALGGSAVSNAPHQGAGGGGLSGNGGGFGNPLLTGGGGGGGSRGDGAPAEFSGGGGGGTVFAGNASVGGLLCGGDGGLASDEGNDGSSAPCAGGGGGGSGAAINALIQGGGNNGGDGNYGGGGGGAGASEKGGTGGKGGFGGGGGGAASGSGGNGGFGGGGGGGNVCGFLDLSSDCPGHGGPFGGDGMHSGLVGGGGGGALGGAIFSDSGNVTVRNRTFYNNSVTRGLGLVSGTDVADNGADAGSAIFSRNGSLTVVDVTISGNLATGSGGGIVVYEDGLPTTFTLNDTIIYNNGGQECFYHGRVTHTGVTNLIGQNFGCKGNIADFPSDPQLGPLGQNGGITPTMAIPFRSSAFNAADPVTSLPADQRGQTRPGMSSFPDIGAFELCLKGNPLIDALPCPIFVPIEVLNALTVQVSPAAGGMITNPQAAVTNYPVNAIVPLSATASPGYAFVNWTGSPDVADPNNRSTTVTMTQDEFLTANFAPVACVTNLTGRGTVGLFGRSDRIDLTWTGLGTATSYNVLRGTAPGGENPVPIGTTTGTAYTDTKGLVRGTTYYYVLQPLNGTAVVCTSNEVAVGAP